MLAFDRIYDSAALKELSKERGYDVREHIAKDLFFNIGDFFAHRMPIETAMSSNLSGPMVQLAQVGTMLSRPDYIEWLNRYLEATLDNFVRDGMYPESFAYHRGYADANLAVAEAVGFYFTVHPADTEALRAAKAGAEGRIARLKRSVGAQYAVSLPNGDMAPFDDTPFGSAPRRESTRSALLPAYGHAMLGVGEGALQTQLNLNFNDHANHVRHGVLAMTLYAFGNELIGNNRYVHLGGRPFLNSTMDHNTVTIDRMDQERTNMQVVGNAGHLFTGGNVMLYEPGVEGISAVEVDGGQAYLNVPGAQYRRVCVLNTVDAVHPYVLDVFRVGGGKTHDYFLHGSVRFDETAQASFKMEAIRKEFPLLEEGEKWVEPKGQSDANTSWYGAFREMSAGRPAGNWNVTFREAKEGKLGTRIFMADEGDVEVYVGKSPVASRGDDRGVERDSIFNFWRPAVMVRRKAAGAVEGLQSLYVGVIEPLSGEGVIEKVERIGMREKGMEGAGVKVTFAGGREDSYVVDLRMEGEGAVETADGAMALRGRVGVVSKSGGVARGWVIGGGEFKYGGGSVGLKEGAYRGTVLGVVRKVEGGARDAFVTDAVLPEGEVLKGRWMRLAFGTYKVVADVRGGWPMGIREQKGIGQMFLVDHVERREGKTWICLSEDAELEVKEGKVRELLRPHRMFEGGGGFEILMSGSGGR